jgi:hypothetical protein
MSNGMNIKFDESMREQFRKAYKAALKAGSAQFVFDGNDYDLRYAGYLLEYLDMKLK